MILNSQSNSLNLSVKLTIEGKDCTIFINSESMKSFICGEFGHTSGRLVMGIMVLMEI